MKRQYQTSTSANLAAQRIPRLETLAPEAIQVVAVTDDAPPEAESTAGLIDQWGRCHPLRARSVVGRGPGPGGIAIIEPSVSRCHAELKRAATGWFVRDLGSTNGTYLDGRRINSEVPLADRQLVIFGEVGAIFVTDRATVDASEVDSVISHTSSSDRQASLRLIEPGVGTGGVVEYRGQRVQLGDTQFALLQLLSDRWLTEQTRDPELRGYVRSIDILVRLPWNTAHPNENNVKQVVRRTRRALESLGLAEAIESRQGFGYRICVAPVLAAEES